MAALILIRGAGDLASGVALRLYRCGLRVILTELPQPRLVRRLAAFGEAVYRGQFSLEGVNARAVNDPTDTLTILMTLSKGLVPVLVDPSGESISALHPTVVVDARMLKESVPLDPRIVPLLLGLGPGFEAGINCHAAIETNRGHYLGRVIWQGKPQLNTGVPDAVGERRAERVLQAPAEGIFRPLVEIGDHVEAGQTVAEVEGMPIQAVFPGVLRGILHADLPVQPGWKVGDVDPRDEPRYCSLVSDKSLAVGGGVLEAILSRAELRRRLWE